MRILRPYLRYTAIYLILASTLLATARTCRIIFPERPNDFPQKVYLFDGITSNKIILPSNNFSRIIELPSSEITIALLPNDIRDLNKLPNDAPQLKIPEGIEDFYILVTVDPNNKILPVQMKILDVGNGKLKNGETLWINLSEHQIVAELGDAKMTTDPEKQSISKNPMPKSGYYKAKFEYKKNGKGKLAPITEQHWWYDAKNRHLGIIMNSNGKLPKIYLFRDFRP